MKGTAGGLPIRTCEEAAVERGHLHYEYTTFVTAVRLSSVWARLPSADLNVRQLDRNEDWARGKEGEGSN